MKRLQEDSRAQRAGPTLELQRRAAAIGPGYRGQRTTATATERAEFAQLWQSTGQLVPPYLAEERRWIDRSAKLFEAGDYPDKGVTISQEDLASIAANFDLPVPVLVEHTTSPLELGFLTHVEMRGQELFGVIALTQEADTLLRQSGAKSLSIGLDREMRRIREVSLVQNPRVRSARLFTGCTHMEGGRLDDDLPDRLAEMRAEMARERAERRVAEFVRLGKLLPSQASMVETLLSRCELVEFDGSAVSVGQLVETIFDRQPSHRLTEEVGRMQAVEQAAAHLMLPEEAEFYRRHFPGVDLAEIAQRRQA